MWQLDSITIQPTGESAWFGGGTIVRPVIEYLWDKGYVTTTGGCECVGMLGAGLGGGHGRFEGLYGLISDNIRQFNVVLANGTATRVSWPLASRWISPQNAASRPSKQSLTTC